MFCFFFNDTATTEIYTLSLHDALPILVTQMDVFNRLLDTTPLTAAQFGWAALPALALLLLWEGGKAVARRSSRSEEHTSELQSRQYLVCRLLLEKKKKEIINSIVSVDT